jgi:hypothetical protein
MDLKQDDWQDMGFKWGYEKLIGYLGLKAWMFCEACVLMEEEYFEIVDSTQVDQSRNERCVSVGM